MSTPHEFSFVVAFLSRWLRAWAVDRRRNVRVRLGRDRGECQRCAATRRRDQIQKQIQNYKKKKNAVLIKKTGGIFSVFCFFFLHAAEEVRATIQRYNHVWLFQCCGLVCCRGRPRGQFWRCGRNARHKAYPAHVGYKNRHKYTCTQKVSVGMRWRVTQQQLLSGCCRVAVEL